MSCCDRLSSVPAVVRCCGVVPLKMTAAESSLGRPCEISDAAMHVKLGVSRSVKLEASVPRRRCTRSRNAPASSVSKATTNSWSSRPNEYVVWLSTCGYSRPIWMWFCITR